MMAKILKEATASFHQEVENLNPLLTPGFSRSDYATYLGVLAGYYQKLESQIPSLQAHLPRELQLADRMKLDLLLADLQALNAPLIPMNFPLPKLQKPAQFWGHFYVLEGSTLGGQVISRRLQENLNLNVNQLNFFNSYREKTMPMWREFTSLLNAQSFSELEIHDVLAAAHDGFTTYGLLLQQIQRLLDQNRSLSKF